MGLFDIPGEGGWQTSFSPGEGGLGDKWRWLLTGSADKNPAAAAGLQGLGSALKPPGGGGQQQTAAAPAAPAPPMPPRPDTSAILATMMGPGQKQSPFSAAPGPRRRPGSIYGAEGSSPFTPA